MSNEQKTSENPKGHAPLAGVMPRFSRESTEWAVKRGYVPTYGVNGVIECEFHECKSQHCPFWKECFVKGRTIEVDMS